MEAATKRTFIVMLAKGLMPLCLLLFLPLGLSAQDQPEYRAEIGAGAGLVSYQGDLNGNLLKNLQPMGTIVGRYKMNPRMAWALSVSVGKLSGSADGVNTWYPDLQGVEAKFSNTLVDAGLRYEYNFWPYGTGREYRGARPLVPFVTLGLGATVVSGDHSEVTANMPLGLGVKYKVGERLNLTVAWTTHFSLSDELDGVKDPYGIKSSGIFKNTDCYSALGLTLTYDLWAKCKVCHNDKD